MGARGGGAGGARDGSAGRSRGGSADGPKGSSSGVGWRTPLAVVAPSCSPTPSSMLCYDTRIFRKIQVPVSDTVSDTRTP